eukprot:10973539-Lingulodinium_polyedra.AAC.1
MPISERGSRTRGRAAGFAGQCSCRASHTSHLYLRARAMASSEALPCLSALTMSAGPGCPRF